MKVLFLTNVPAPYRVDFFNELGKLCELTVLYELGSASDRNKEWKGESAKNFKEVYLRGKKIGNDSAICFSVIKYLRSNEYNIIVVGGYSTPTGIIAIETLRLLNKTFLLNTDGGIIKADSKLKFIIKKHFISSARAWLSTGKKTSEYLINYGAKADEIYTYPLTSIKEKEVVKSIIDYQEKIKLREELGITEEKIIISVGQFIHRKGFDILIESARRLSKDCGIYIIGGKPTEDYLELVKKYNLKNVHFEGFKTKEQLKNYYKVADLFVLPTREDIWGLVINEAMACGLPVITTNKCVAGIELIKDNECGLIIDMDNINKLSEYINNLICDNCALNRMTEQCLKVISEYTIENMAKRHIKIFENIMEKDCYDSKG